VTFEAVCHQKWARTRVLAGGNGALSRRAPSCVARPPILPQILAVGKPLFQWHGHVPLVIFRLRFGLERRWLRSFIAARLGGCGAVCYLPRRSIDPGRSSVRLSSFRRTLTPFVCAVSSEGDPCTSSPSAGSNNPSPSPPVVYNAHPSSTMCLQRSTCAH